MRGSAESIDRTSTNTPPMSATGTAQPPQSPSTSISATSTNSITASQTVSANNISHQTPLHLQQQLQPGSRKTRYLSHYSSLPTLKSKRSFSSIRYNELKRISSPTREYYRLQSTLSPSKHNGNGFNNTVHFNHYNNNHSNSNGNITGNSNGNGNGNNTAVPIDLATTLHPPVPQCSTPSTLATQSTAESVSTAISDKRGDASTSPISVNSEISSMVITDGKSVSRQAEVEAGVEAGVEAEEELNNSEATTADAAAKPVVVVSTRDLDSSLPALDSASTISSHLFPIPQLGHSNDNLILLPSESTILNKLSPRGVDLATTTTPTTIDNETITLESASSTQLNKIHPHIVLAPPPSASSPSSDIHNAQALPSPTTLTVKQSHSSSSLKKLNNLGRPKSPSKSTSRRPLSSAESNSFKQTQIPPPKKTLDAPMSKYEYNKYPNREAKLSKMTMTRIGSNADAVSFSSNASSSSSTTLGLNEIGVGGAALSITLTNEAKLKRGGQVDAAVGPTTRRRGGNRGGHTRSKSNVEDSLSLAGMKRSSRFFDWLRKK